MRYPFFLLHIIYKSKRQPPPNVRNPIPIPLKTPSSQEKQIRFEHIPMITRSVLIEDFRLDETADAEVLAAFTQITEGMILPGCSAPTPAAAAAPLLRKGSGAGARSHATLSNSGSLIFSVSETEPVAPDRLAQNLFPAAPAAYARGGSDPERGRKKRGPMSPLATLPEPPLRGERGSGSEGDGGGGGSLLSHQRSVPPRGAAPSGGSRPQGSGAGGGQALGVGRPLQAQY